MNATTNGATRKRRRNRGNNSRACGNRCRTDNCAWSRSANTRSACRNPLSGSGATKNVNCGTRRSNPCSNCRSRNTMDCTGNQSRARTHKGNRSARNCPHTTLPRRDRWCSHLLSGCAPAGRGAHTLTKRCYQQQRKHHPAPSQPLRWCQGQPPEKPGTSQRMTPKKLDRRKMSLHPYVL